MRFQTMSRHPHLQVFLISSYTHHDAYCSLTVCPSFLSHTIEVRKGSTWKTRSFNFVLIQSRCLKHEPGDKLDGGYKMEHSSRYLFRNASLLDAERGEL